ncbi:MAG: ABC transporter ATP-binding protein [Pseudomonadota bacterium]
MPDYCPESEPLADQEKRKKKHEVAVSIRNVGVRYVRRQSLLTWKTQPFWALKDVSFDIRQGQTTGIIGKNGAGKSSLISAIAGIIKPDRGWIDSHGRQIRPLSVKAGLARTLSGRENAMISGMLMGLSREQIRQRMPEIIKFAELEEFIDDPLGTYSSGMAARLGFSVAIHVETDVMLIDEALAAGDASFREKSAEALRKVIQSDKTVVLVSHNAQTIRSLCDHAVWIDQGTVRMQGDPTEVLQAYERVHEIKKANRKNKNRRIRRRMRRLKRLVTAATESGFIPDQSLLRPGKRKKNSAKSEVPPQ